MKGKMNVSFSGGRTSALMTKLLIDNLSDQYDFIVTFANTGIEHEKTLEFVNNCDIHFGFNTVWLESETIFDARESSKHKIVTFKTASRNGEPFEQSIKKYGIPNVSFPGCTRELKVNPIKSYLKSLGFNYKDIPTAIGIRADESRRVAKSAEKENVIYPLIDLFPSDKTDVLNFWEDQIFDLGIEEFEGNCKGCYKKSMAKLFMQIDKDPTAFDFHRRMESLYQEVGPQDGKRVFFRGNRSTEMLFKLRKEAQGKVILISSNENSGCTESCELFEME